MYLYAPLGLTSLVFKAVDGDVANASSESEFSQWASRVQTLVRPTLKFVVLLHIAAFIAGIWKIQRLEDNRAAVVFGVLETSVVFGYQVFLAVFALDDVMIGKTIPGLGHKLASS